MQSIILDRSVRRLLPALAASAIVAHLGLAQDTDCPNIQAMQVNTKVVTTGDSERCGLGIQVFGFGFAFFGELCPDKKETIPAHQVCDYETEAKGKNCLFEVSLETIVEECDCGGLVLPLLDTGIPTSCKCEIMPMGGTVEDFKTVECDV